MRFNAGFAAVAIAALSACDSPPAQNSPPDEGLVNATRTDQAYPSEATGNDIISGEAVTADAAGNSTASANSTSSAQTTGQQTNGQ